MFTRFNKYDSCPVSLAYQNLSQVDHALTQTSAHNIQDIIDLFNDCFFDRFNTRLVKGNDEPIYLPAGETDINIPAQSYAQVVFAHGYYASALHEIAHWCLAGEQRRKLVDFGYWYCPDGRTAEQQKTFQQAEIKPQSIEWALSIAAGFKFNVSCDNLSGDEFGNQPDSQAFEQDILKQINDYLVNGFPPRAQQLMETLAERYQQTIPTNINQFIPSFKLDIK
ncbi:elongation factor P hydroxylase [Psychrosphaera aquimarina]|uniref:Elongation factor P hydroxylase n=1 Tax=Psychrosphaera aquimarina TaxID=2044854 RepID=A0ABU3R4B1_9GAMM|nr:elongation factor P hydroxylase [Psychrosphaera aquimarina]MDU0114520.1 elongation factor P hydroxylase [Psychrosphaera aquimarina]